MFYEKVVLRRLLTRYFFFPGILLIRYLVVRNRKRHEERGYLHKGDGYLSSPAPGLSKHGESLPPHP